MERDDDMIVYVLPEYTLDLGDCCRVCDTNGEILYKKKIHSVIRDIFREKYIDFEAVKHKSSVALNQKNLNPLYIGPGEILIPVKTRKPLILKDSSYGYINVAEISKIVDNHIILKGNHKVFFYDTKRIITRRIKMAKILESCFPNDLNIFQPMGSYNHGITCFIDYFLNEMSNIKKLLERCLVPIIPVQPEC